jgi:hypothetical protein
MKLNTFSASRLARSASLSLPSLSVPADDCAKAAEGANSAAHRASTETEASLGNEKRLLRMGLTLGLR